MRVPRRLASGSRVLYATTFVLLASAPPALAQGTDTATAIVLLPGAELNTARLAPPWSNRWRITYQLPDGREVPGGATRVALWYDSVGLVTEGGRQLLHRRQVLYNPANTLLETIDNWVDPHTLAPVRTQTRYPASGVSLRTYDGAHVTGSDPDTSAADGVRRINVTLAQAPFDFFGGLYDVLIAALPLRAGYVARIPADYSGAPGGAALQWVTLRVLGREQLAAYSGGPASVWHVETGATPMGRFAFWVTEQPPHLVRMWYIGPRGGKQIWNVG